MNKNELEDNIVNAIDIYITILNGDEADKDMVYLVWQKGATPFGLAKDIMNLIKENQ